MSNINKTLRKVQKINILKNGFTEHYTDYNPMKFQKENSNLTTNNRENIILLSKHFHRVCNR